MLLSLLAAGAAFGADQPAAPAQSELEGIANDRIFFSLSADGRRFELGFADGAPTLSGDRGCST